MRAPMGLEYEMTFAERIEGPLGRTTGSPSRLCWKIAEATLTGPRITASLAVPGTDWIRIEPDGTRRQNQRTQFLTNDGTLIQAVICPVRRSGVPVSVTGVRRGWRAAARPARR
jgi:hypothetical protein